MVALAATFGYQYVTFKKDDGSYHSNPMGIVESRNYTLREKLVREREHEVAKREKRVAEREKEALEMEKKATNKQPATTTVAAVENVESIPSTTSKTKAAAHQETSSSSSSSQTLEKVALDRMPPQKRAQIENYINGTALMVNIHPTHHAGTTFCGTIGNSGGTRPKFACMGDKLHVMPDPPCMQSGNGQGKHLKLRQREEPPFCYSYSEMTHNLVPWTKAETGPFVESIRPYFHMISWEFGGYSTVLRHGRKLEDTDWDHPNLLSVIITRDPLSRMLSGDGNMRVKFPGYNTKELSREKWWDYALYSDLKNSDNFFLRILTGDKRKRWSQTQRLIPNHVEAGVNRTTEELMELFPTNLDKTSFEHAKAVLDKFTVVLDIACLNDGLDELARMLHIGPLLTKEERKKKDREEGQQHQRRILKYRGHETPRERIQYEDVYEYLSAKNQWDIALYEYSKTISLVNCENIRANANHIRFR